MLFKKTILHKVHFTGIGVHSGKKINLWIQPSESGKIVFQRTDQGNATVVLDAEKIQSMHNTSLIQEKFKVRTIEHLMAALYVLGINSVLIKINGEEVPILDGSALPFFEEIKKAGNQKLSQKSKTLYIKKSFRIKKNGALMDIQPHDTLKITYIINYNHPCIGKQELTLDIDPATFETDVAPARTFGYLKDAEMLRKQNLALGSSLDNTLVLDPEKIINPPLRFKDEFVRHKILDLIGDLSLLNQNIKGYFRAEKGGHDLHLKTVRFLLKNKNNWKIK
ncbi:MAG: UDP-3-O-[3-hydroxymyristoyl] N-acetylglucosamine deacetylase [Candidatus Aminicenantes bacterium]|nr:UDP-3-O-[3-hydroxymyristoyl] N-acetylglucosamine deacetylase [Candidatus Aminicenantes bacterium]